ncbi:MAG TPA: hypothetical protein VJS45_14980 [Acidimicrobiia bacterium]|nr:hypothetical protein [Acidimicrobiia bacterium]
MEFFVAEQLGMTVADLRARMDQAEFVRWTIYYARRAQRREVAGA